MRDRINEELEKVFDEHFIQLWWSIKLPGLGNAKPIEVLDKDPEGLLNYARGYTKESE